jgi:phosphatidylinositol-3-phosphatase
MNGRRIVLVAVAVALASTVTSAAVASASPGRIRAPQAATVPRPDHTVVVMFENHDYSQINGSTSAPTFNSLAAEGAKFTQAFAVTHPSQPNYIALFSGGTQRTVSDNCPRNFGSVTNLGSQLLGAGFSFTGYAESMPSAGYTGCGSGNYARKHNSWVDFSNVPAADNQPYSSFPTNYASLPAVSFVSPNLCNDMHDCSVATGDTWLKNNMLPYATWALTHNSLLIVTFDEDSGSSVNQIMTFFVGQHVKPGQYAEQINHFAVLHTIESAYGLSAIGSAATAPVVTDCWK